MSTIASPNHRTSTPRNILVKEWLDEPSWDNFVSSVGGSICHLYAWKKIIHQAYRQGCFFLAAERDNNLEGILPLVLTRSSLFGTHLSSMPYLDTGGTLSKCETAQLALLDHARKLAVREKAQLCLRYREHPGILASPSTRRVTMLLELAEDDDQMWSRLTSMRRNRIRKGQKNGLTASWHGIDGLPQFYAVFARNMRDLGSPVHGLSLFQAILQNLPSNAAVLLINDGPLVIGAAICLFYADEICLPWVSSLRTHFHRCPNPLLYWEAMRFGIARGARYLDFGRSTKGDGTYEAKRQWGAEPIQLHWFYEPAIVEDSNAAGKFGRLGEIWKRLPVPLSRVIGPWLRKGIPS